MRISLFAVLCATLCSSLAVHGEVSDEREMASTFTFSVSVLWYNANALPTDCTDAEQTYIMDKMSPNLDFILSKDGYNPVPWSKSKSKLARSRFLRGEQAPVPDRELNLCADCWNRQLGATYCNALYNCGFRRTLTVEQEQPQQHHREDQELTTTSTTTTSTATATGLASKIQTQFTSACTAQLIQLSSDVMLQDSCRRAVAGSVCESTIS